MNVYVATQNPVKHKAVEAVLHEFGHQAAVRRVDARLELPAQPLGEDVERGAIARAQAALRGAGLDGDLGIGIEAGLIRLPSGRWLSTQVCAITDASGRVAVGLGPGYVLPSALEEAVLGGEPLRNAFERILHVSDPEQRGAIHYLSGGRIDREALTREAVRLAFVSWFGGRGEGGTR